MIRYHSASERKSRLARSENVKFMRQTWLIVLGIIALILLLIFFGIPMMIKLAVFFGDLKNSATPIEQVDTIPPSAPQIIPPPEATNSATLVLEGFGEVGSSIQLFQNNNLLEKTLVDQDGHFTFNEVTLEEGINRFYALSLDDAQNESLRSNSFTTIFQSKVPTLNIELPADGQAFYGSDSKTITIKGTTDPEVTIRLNDQYVRVNEDGSFTSTYLLQGGENTLTFKATDIAGNSIEKSLKTTYSD